MPWLALPFDEKRYEALSSHFEVEGIPTLVLLSPEGKVITTKGRAAVSADPEGKDFPNWGPKPVSTLEEVAGDLNESPALIVLCEKASAEEGVCHCDGVRGAIRRCLGRGGRRRRRAQDFVC
jgi:nucleoredoxin